MRTQHIALTQLLDNAGHWVSTVRIDDDSGTFYETMVFDRNDEVDCHRTKNEASARLTHDLKCKQWRAA